MRRLRADGGTYGQIAKEFGVSRSAVHYHARDVTIIRPQVVAGDGEVRGEDTDGEGAGLVVDLGAAARSSMFKQTVTLPTRVFQAYDWVVARGYSRSLSQFLDECVDRYFRALGVRPGWFQVEDAS